MEYREKRNIMEKKMKILYDYQTMCLQKFGGISRYFYEVADNLDKSNKCKICIGAKYFNNFYFKKYFEDRGIKYYTGTGKVSKVANITNLIWQLVHRYDIFHATYYNKYGFKFNFGAKKVTTIHDMIPEKYTDVIAGMEEVIEQKKWHIYQSDKIIAVSNQTKEDILAMYPDIPESKIVVIYHGNSMKFDEQKRGTIKFPSKYILFVGNRDYYKNFLKMIEGLSGIFARNQDLNLVCVGGGAFKESEKECLIKNGMWERTEQFSCDDTDLAWAYHNAECFVFPSKYEGFGIPILEAWACDCPIALANASCFPEIAGDAAEYFNPDDADDISRVVSKLLESDQHRSYLVQKGKDRLKSFSWEKAAEQTVAVYHSLIDGTK